MPNRAASRLVLCEFSEETVTRAAREASGKETRHCPEEAARGAETAHEGNRTLDLFFTKEVLYH